MHIIYVIFIIIINLHYDTRFIGYIHDYTMCIILKIINKINII